MSKNTEKEVGRLPRSVKYAWGVAVTALLAISLVLEKDSGWQPLINQAIDLLQLQAAPTSSK
jgi:hypothetical protein